MYTQSPIHQDGFSDLLNTYALPASLAQGYAVNQQNQNYNSPAHSNISSGRTDKSTSHQFECKYCNRFFSQNQTLKQHILTHTGQRPFECKICFKSFTQQGSLQRHLTTHTGAKPYECRFCPFSSSQKNNLQRHENIHTGALKEFQCQICHRAFDRKRTLQRHQQVHLPKDGRPKVNCTCCNRTFRTKEILQKHLKREEEKLRGNEDSNWLTQTNTETRKYKHIIINCRHCGKTFRRSASTLSVNTDIIASSCLQCSYSYTGAHVPWGIYKDVELFECEFCKAQFTNKDYFEKHRETHSYKHECEICHRRFKVKGLLKRHIVTQHDTGNSQCHICGLNFKYVSKLKAHYHLCHAEELKDDLDEYVTLFTCADCGRICYLRAQMAQHVRRHLKNPITRNRTNDTDKTSDKREVGHPQHFLEPYLKLANVDRQQNTKSQSQNRRQACSDDDDVQFDPMEDEYFLGTEFEADKAPPKEQPFFCYICKRTYGSKATLNQHFQTEHEEHDDFECEYCAKAFRSKNSLYKHKQTHRPGAYKCDQCDKSFGRKFSLTSHVLTHSEKNVKCPYCPKKFYMKSQLRTHLKTHRGEKNFECGVCEKKFYDLTRLNRHHLTHSGERNFTCHICQLSFIQKNHLDKHLLRHDEIEKKVTYECEHCKKIFYRKDNYLRHRESHDENRTQYPCPLCQTKFKDRYVMKRHMGTKRCVNSKVKIEVNEESAKKGSKKTKKALGNAKKKVGNKEKGVKKKVGNGKKEKGSKNRKTVDKKGKKSKIDQKGAKKNAKESNKKKSLTKKEKKDVDKDDRESASETLEREKEDVEKMEVTVKLERDIDNEQEVVWNVQDNTGHGDACEDNEYVDVSHAQKLLNDEDGNMLTNEHKLENSNQINDQQAGQVISAVTSV